jgi:hypothetical protein
MFFYNYFCLMIEGSISLTNTVALDQDRGGSKHMDPMDPDPDLQHCLAVTVYIVECCQILECKKDLLLKVVM